MRTYVYEMWAVAGDMDENDEMNEMSTDHGERGGWCVVVDGG